MPEDQPSNVGPECAGDAEAVDVDAVAPSAPAETRFSKIRRSWSSIATAARQSHAVIAPLANSAARNISVSAKSAYDVATSEQAVALYRHAGHEAARVASAGTRATVDASRKVRDTLTSDDAKVVYGQIGDAANVAASHGAKLAGGAASIAGHALKNPIVRNVTAMAAAAIVTEVADYYGASWALDTKLADITEKVVNTVGRGGRDASIVEDDANPTDPTDAL